MWVVFFFFPCCCTTTHVLLYHSYLTNPSLSRLLVKNRNGRRLRGRSFAQNSLACFELPATLNQLAAHLNHLCCFKNTAACWCAAACVLCTLFWGVSQAAGEFSLCVLCAIFFGIKFIVGSICLSKINREVRKWTAKKTPLWSSGRVKSCFHTFLKGKALCDQHFWVLLVPTGDKIKYAQRTYSHTFALLYHQESVTALLTH